MANAKRAREVTNLQMRLAALIRAHGPIGVDDYMADALGHPQEGYYMTQDPIGAAGDFTTAPEVSQMFGELICAWLAQSWSDMGEPSIVQLVELGPGRGVLMADILRSAAVAPQFAKALRVTLIETSGRLRYRQQAALKDFDTDIRWTANLSEAAPGPLLLIANEFLDCLPIKQYVKSNGRWRERRVGLKPGNACEELAFITDEAAADVSAFLPKELAGAEEGAVFEHRAAMEPLIAEVGFRLNEFKGRALFIDYGHERSGVGDTLQAVRGHGYWPPLASPGLADITSHVDFGAVIRAAEAAGTSVHGPVSQRDFLFRCGLAARADALKQAGAAPETIDSAVRRLTDPDQMGALFKCLCLSHKDLPAPAAFAP